MSTHVEVQLSMRNIASNEGMLIEDELTVKSEWEILHIPVKAGKSGQDNMFLMIL